MKKLLILSGKGGTGKTTTAAAFIDFLNAKAFADCDVDAPNLHIVVGIKSKPETTDYFGLQKSNIDAEKCKNCGLCYKYCRFDAIKKVDNHFEVCEYNCEGCGVCAYVCPAQAVTMKDDVSGEIALYREDRVFSTAKLKMGRGNSGKLVSEVKAKLSEYAPETKLQIIDGSPGIGCPVIASVTGVDMVLIVSEPSLSGISDLKRIVETAKILEVKIAVCVNKYDLYQKNTELIEAFCTENNLAFAGKIPYDKMASKAINEGHSLASVDCSAGHALKEVFRSVLAIMEVS
ncbi:MAG: ATPase [Clostridia bacterium]|nr:ATPase [Clostridia bacterium]